MVVASMVAVVAALVTLAVIAVLIVTIVAVIVADMVRSTRLDLECFCDTTTNKATSKRGTQH